MTRKTLGKDGLPLSLRQKMAKVGLNIKLARKRRGLTMQDMAERMFVTRKTLNRLESGDAGVSFGILAAALLTLGLENDLSHLAKPENDLTANIIDKQSYDQKKRIRPSRKVDLDF
ncbi:MAG: helix-turn-helix transcriptional regulator [Deltaproteobacteria bacterium]|jgi:transcriptional regulator with XRE-family HTH domain|nr:helix-turn-helix transcriptional regulator [Deltaproteobacteria bacterium]